MIIIEVALLIIIGVLLFELIIITIIFKIWIFFPKKSYTNNSNYKFINSTNNKITKELENLINEIEQEANNNNGKKTNNNDIKNKVNGKSIHNEGNSFLMKKQHNNSSIQYDNNYLNHANNSIFSSTYNTYNDVLVEVVNQN